MRIYSKEAQDGILQAIFKLVQATNKQAVEFGLSVPAPPPNRTRPPRVAGCVMTFNQKAAW